MPGRNYSAGSEYRYGFNGKENDKDMGKEVQDYGLRIYDARLGRFLSVDPLTDDYPSWSPYPFAMNRPIDGIDLDGGEWRPYGEDENGAPTDYEWVGYNADGSAPEGTVGQGTVTKNGITAKFSSFYSPTSSTTDKDGNVTLGGPMQFGSISFTSTYDRSGHGSFYADAHISIYDNAISLSSTNKNSESGVTALNTIYNGSTANQGFSVNSLVTFADAQVQQQTNRFVGRLEGVDFSSVNVEDLIGIGQVFSAIGKNFIRKATTREFINLASPTRTNHILAGDATGGGHSWFSSFTSFSNGITGKKTMFPMMWSENKIMHASSSVLVNNPILSQTGPVGSLFEKSGRLARFTTIGTYENVKIKVVWNNLDIITAHPIKSP